MSKSAFRRACARMKVTAILPIGVPDEKPKARTRKDFSEIFFKEKWQT